MRIIITFITFVTILFAAGISSAQEYAPDATGHSDPVQIQVAHEMINIINGIRTQMGQYPLVFNPQLTAAAQGHVNDMAVNHYFSHTSIDGRSAGDRIRQAGYHYAWYGENLAQRWDITGAGAFDQFWNSPPHQAIMIDPNYREAGIAFAVSDTGEIFYALVLGVR